MRALWITLVVLLVLVAILWIGLRVPPRPFPAPAAAGLTAAQPETVPLPAGLPAPVDRFFRTVYGDDVPVITSAVIDGRGRIAPFGFFMPARFRFVHEAGLGYRHYIEATWFGLPIFKVNERYVDGASFFQLPVLGITSDNQNLRSAANLGLWSESVWLPAIWATDPRVRWQAVDDNTALLVVPFEPAGEPAAEQTFVIRFDPGTGLITWMETLRNRDANNDEQILWITWSHDWREIDGALLPASGDVTWYDQGGPWARFGIESITYNADVTQYIRRTGL